MGACCESREDIIYGPAGIAETVDYQKEKYESGAPVEEGIYKVCGWTYLKSKGEWVGTGADNVATKFFLKKSEGDVVFKNGMATMKGAGAKISWHVRMPMEYIPHENDDTMRVMFDLYKTDESADGKFSLTTNDDYAMYENETILGREMRDMCSAF